jgi:hypothetical protein
MAEIGVPAALPRQPVNVLALRRTNTYLAAVTAVGADPSPANLYAAAWSAMDLSSLYGPLGFHPANIGLDLALMRAANAYIAEARRRGAPPPWWVPRSLPVR